MSPSRRPDRRTFYAYFFCLTLAIWIGASIVVDFLIVPGLFTQLDRNVAIDLGAWVYGRWNITECLLGASCFLFAAALGRAGWSTRRRHLAACGLAGAMTLTALAFLLVLTPTIAAQVAALREQGVDLTDLDLQPSARATLHTWHTIYAGLDVAKILCGLVLFWLLVSRRRVG